MESQAQKTRNVLVLSYAFPPALAVGGRRIEAFCRHLPSLGWTPIIIAAAAGTSLQPGWGRWQATDVCRTSDLSALSLFWRMRNALRLNRKIGVDSQAASENPQRKSGQIRRTVMGFLKTPDEQLLGWAPLAVAAGLRIARRRSVDLILVSSPPHSAHLAGLVLAKILKRPLVLDFRDPWTMNEYAENFWPTKTLRKWNAKLERAALRSARYVIANTPTAEEMFLERYPWLAARLTTIHNGFEPSALEGLVPRRFDKFTLTHAGSFYGERNPRCFLEGLARWLNQPESTERKRNTHVLFIGRNDASTSETVARLGLGDVVTLAPSVPLSELYPLLAGSSALLLTLGFRPNSRYVIPAKLYDYLAVGRPVLAFVPEEGEASKLLSDRKRHMVVTQDDPEAVVRILDKLYADWQHGASQVDTSRVGTDAWRQFWYPRLTERLAEVLAQAKNETHAAPTSPGSI